MRAWQRKAKTVAAGLTMALAVTACGSEDAGEPSSTEAQPDQATEASDTGSGDGADADVPNAPDDGVTEDSIRVGWMGDLTGPTASAQVANLAGIEAYFDQVNSEGGVLGRELELISKDDQYNADRIVSNFRSLADDERVLVLNHVGLSELVVDDLEATGLSLVGPPQSIDASLASDYAFHVLAHYADEADVAIARMESRIGAMEDVRAAVVQLEVPSGDQWNAYIEDKLTERGGTYLGRLTMDPANPDASVVGLELARLQEEEGLNYVAFHGAPATALQVLTAMSDQGLDLPMVGIHGLAAVSVYEEGPQDSLDGVEGVHSFLPGSMETPATEELRAAVEGTEHEDQLSHLNFTDGWVDGMIIRQAIERAAEDSGELTRATLHEALQGEFDVDGLTCPVDWTGSNYSPCAAPFEWTGDGLEPVEPFDAWADAIGEPAA